MSYRTHSENKFIEFIVLYLHDQLIMEVEMEFKSILRHIDDR